MDSLSNRCRRNFPGRDQIPGRTHEKAGHRRQLRNGRHTESMVKLLEEGIIHKILTVQAFDQYAIRSLLKDVNHIEIGAASMPTP